MLKSRAPSLLLRLLAMSLFLLLLPGCPAWAQGATEANTVASADAALNADRDALAAAEKRLEGKTADGELSQLRAGVLATQADSERIADELAPAMASVTARLTGLGPVVSGVTEAPDVAAQRADLDKERKAIDAQIKLARLLSVESGQLADRIAAMRRAQFTAQIGERTASVLAPPFWAELRSGISRDIRQLRRFGQTLSSAASATPAQVWFAMLGLGLAAVALRVWLGRLLLQVTVNRVAPGRLRRSLLALVKALLAVVIPGVIAHLLRLSLTWTLTPTDPVQPFLAHMVGMVCFGAFVAGLGNALLSSEKPSWRLPPLPDAIARALVGYPLLLGMLMVAGWLLEQLAGIVNAGLATTVALDCAFALVLGALLASALRQAGKARGTLAAGEGADQPGAVPNGVSASGHSVSSASERPAPAAPEPAPPGHGLAHLPWVSIATSVLWLLLAGSLVCVLVGYVALGSFLVKQLAWIGTVLATGYLVNALVDDACMAWLGPAGNAHATAPEDIRARVRAQAAVLLSAVGRLAVLLFALVLIASPFGQGPLDLLGRADGLRDGVVIGQIHLQPSTVLQALFIFVVGTLAVRLMQRWLRDRYLPTTGLDAAMRESATTLLGFIGTLAALAFALSAIGLGLERIAWVASALSVGIGFGLQAVVSNFVSGLILLAERPVKVGDWVSLGGVEGDIRRINVRATEIQMGDRSTAIVPNSEFITKTVRNVTHANPLGLVVIKFPMPLDTDVTKVREIILAAFSAREEVLDKPAANVFIDGIENGQIMFNANGSVSSPRAAYGVKSSLLFDILAKLREAGLPLARPTTMLLRDAPSAPGTPGEAVPASSVTSTAVPLSDLPPPGAARG